MNGYLSIFDSDEKEAALNAYTELFDRAGEEGERELIAALGSPMTQAIELNKRCRKASLEDVLQALLACPDYLPSEIKESVQLSEAELPVDEPETQSAELQLEHPESDLSTIGEQSSNSETENLAIDTDVSSEMPEETADETEKAPDETADELIVLANEDSHSGVQEEEPKLVLVESPVGEEKREEAEKPFLEEDKAAEIPSVPLPVPAEERQKSQKKSKGKADKAAKAKNNKPKTGAVILAVLVTPVLIVVAAAIIALLWVLSVIPGAVGGVFGAIGYYFATYALSAMNYMPDRLIVGGVALIFLGFALGLLASFLRVLFRGLRSALRFLTASYAKILGKEKNDE